MKRRLRVDITDPTGDTDLLVRAGTMVEVSPFGDYPNLFEGVASGQRFVVHGDELCPERRRLRHDTDVAPAGTLVEVLKAADSDPEYALVDHQGLVFPIHWDELDPEDEPYEGDTQ